MPLPEPKDNEEKQEFTERCMSNDVMKREFPENKQRYAVCMKQWEGENEDIDLLKRIDNYLNKDDKT